MGTYEIKNHKFFYNENEHSRYIECDKRAYFTECEMKSMFKEFEIIKFKEVEKDTKIALNNTKHWNLFEVLAKELN